MLKRKRVFYKTFDGRYCSLYRGAEPDRVYHQERPTTLKEVPPPPVDGDYPQQEYYLGRRRQWRVTAHVDIDWDRQGIHFPLGFLIGGLASVGTAPGIALAFLVAAGFIVYEVRESGSVNDLDWIDIGATLAGLILFAGGWLAYQVPAVQQWTAGLL